MCQGLTRCPGGSMLANTCSAGSLRCRRYRGGRVRRPTSVCPSIRHTEVLLCALALGSTMNVVEGVERDDAVERFRGERKVCEVADEERRVRDRSALYRQLDGGEVEPDVAPAVG